MNPLIQEGKLNTDIDFAGFRILNSGDWVPVPPSITALNDVRLDDTRPVPTGSVTKEKVFVNAGIEQSKLLLDGVIPPSWLGNANGKAAQGNLVEQIANRGTINGHVELDADGRIKVADLPSTGPQTGTVTKVGLQVPPGLLQTQPPVTTAGALITVWDTEPPESWFGVDGTASLDQPTTTPSFISSPVPSALVPDLAATIFTTGSFDPSFLPKAKGLGAGHAIGLLPDPMMQDEGHFDDYLGRDMIWKTMRQDVPYQPMLPDVQLTFLGYYRDQANVSMFCPQKGSDLFYLTFNPEGLPPVIPSFMATSNPATILITPGWVVQAYAAKAGWNNSNMAKYMPPQPQGI